MKRAEALQEIMNAPDDEEFIIVKRSTRHRRVDDERARYLRIEVRESQRDTWKELWETLMGQCNGNKTSAFDRVLAGMSEEIAQGNAG